MYSPPLNLLYCGWVNSVAGDYCICGHEEEIRRGKANNQLEVRPSMHPAPGLFCSLHRSCFRSSGNFLAFAITVLESKSSQYLPYINHFENIVHPQFLAQFPVYSTEFMRYSLMFVYKVFLVWNSAEGLHGPEPQRGAGVGKEGLPPSQRDREKIESVPTQSDWEVRKGSFHPLRRSPQLGHGEFR